MDDTELPPTLCIAVADDTSVPASSFDCFLPGGAKKREGLQLEVLPRGGHMLPLTEPERLARCLKNHWKVPQARSEEHTSELQSIMRTSTDVFCLKKKKITNHTTHTTQNTHN